LFHYPSVAVGHRFTLPDHGHGACAPVYISAFASTHCAYPQRDGQAELTWVAGYIPRWLTRLQTVTYSSTNQVRRWLTSYQLSQTATGEVADFHSSAVDL